MHQQDEGFATRVVRWLRKLVSYALIVILCLPLVLGCYALWDSHVVVEHAHHGQWQPYKPTEPEPISFWELQRINPEVRAWLSVYGTSVDYPVCQAQIGEEDKYLTSNAKGEYSLSGALFMDVANASDFSDFSTIIYGHHMENGVMFGPITDFADEQYFLEHRFGNLFANDRDYGLEFFCYLDADAYDRSIYRHRFVGEGEKEGYVALLRERARWWREGVEVGEDDHILVLSTCSSGSTNARALLIAKVCEEEFKNPFVKIPNFGTGVDALEGLFGVPWLRWGVLGLFIVVLLVLVIVKLRGRA
jgi:sortase B